MSEPSIWDDPDLQTGDNFFSFDHVGDTLQGRIEIIKRQIWADGSVSPQLFLTAPDGTDVILSAGQIRLKNELVAQRPAPGDDIWIRMTNIENRGGGKTLKHFDVRVRHNNIHGYVSQFGKQAGQQAAAGWQGQQPGTAPAQQYQPGGAAAPQFQQQPAPGQQPQYASQTPAPAGPGPFQQQPAPGQYQGPPDPTRPGAGAPAQDPWAQAPAQNTWAGQPGQQQQLPADDPWAQPMGQQQPQPGAGEPPF
jgi:hypothetical protein